MGGPTLSFTDGFDEITALEVEAKGYYARGVAVLPNGRRYRICFYDPARLGQDLETEMAEGEACIGEPGLIVIPSVNRQNMEAAILRLFRQGYFEHLVPL